METAVRQIIKKPLEFFVLELKARQEFDEAELRQLGESIKEHGQTSPVRCLPNGVVVAGNRRVRAAKLVGLTHLDADIVPEPLSPTQVQVLELVDNVNKVDLSPVEKYRACQQLLQLNASWTLRDLARTLHVDPSSLTRLMSIGKVPPAAVAALEKGSVGISEIYELSKMDAADQPTFLAMMLNGSTRDEVASVGRQHRNGNGHAPAEKVSRLRLLLPGGTTVVVSSAKGLGLPELIELLAGLSKECKRALEQGMGCPGLVAVLRDKSKA